MCHIQRRRGHALAWRECAFTRKQQHAHLQLHVAGGQPLQHHPVVSAPSQMQAQALSGFLVGHGVEQNSARKCLVRGSPAPVLTLGQAQLNGLPLDREFGAPAAVKGEILGKLLWRRDHRRRQPVDHDRRVAIIEQAARKRRHIGFRIKLDIEIQQQAAIGVDHAEGDAALADFLAAHRKLAGPSGRGARRPVSDQRRMAEKAAADFRVQADGCIVIECRLRQRPFGNSHQHIKVDVGRQFLAVVDSDRDARGPGKHQTGRHAVEPQGLGQCGHV